MKAMVLSAGLGRRMLPITVTVPKPAIPVLGRPMVVQVLNRLARHGVDEAVVNLHHLPDVLRRLLAPGAAQGLPAVHFSPEPEILGTAGALARARDRLCGAGPVLVHNCDFLSDIDFGAVLDHHARTGAAATLVLAPARPEYSVVEVDADGRVLSLAGEPEADPARVAGRYLFTGCHVVDESVIAAIPGDRPSGIVTHVYRRLAAEGRLAAWLHDGFWWEFGTPSAYLAGTLHLMDLPAERRLEVACHDRVRGLGGGLASTGPGVELEPGVRIDGRAVLGLASHAARDAALSDTVVMTEAWIGARARLRRCIVAPGVEIPADSRFEDAVIAVDPGGEIDLPEPVRRDGGLLVRPLAVAV